MKQTILMLFLVILGCPIQKEKPLGPYPPAEFGPFALRGIEQEEEPRDNPLMDKSISGVITLNQEIANQIAQEPKIIFIIARPVEGGPPLAVKRIQTKKFPSPFLLTSKDVMQPGIPFEGQVKLIARIDQDGRAGPAEKGDFEGTHPKPISVGSKNIVLEINKAY